MVVKCERKVEAGVRTDSSGEFRVVEETVELVHQVELRLLSVEVSLSCCVVVYNVAE